MHNLKKFQVCKKHIISQQTTSFQSIQTFTCSQWIQLTNYSSCILVSLVLWFLFKHLIYKSQLQQNMKLPVYKATKISCHNRLQHFIATKHLHIITSRQPGIDWVGQCLYQHFAVVCPAVCNLFDTFKLSNWTKKSEKAWKKPKKNGQESSAAK